MGKCGCGWCLSQDGHQQVKTAGLSSPGYEERVVVRWIRVLYIELGLLISIRCIYGSCAGSSLSEQQDAALLSSAAWIRALQMAAG